MTDMPHIPERTALYEHAQEAAQMVAAAAKTLPRIGIVLGSGLDALAEAVDVDVSLPFAEIPHLLPTTVVGHKGELVIGTLAHASVAVLRGRLHPYEGYTPAQVTFPIRVLGLLGVETCILTNAAGGLNPALAAGSLMLIRDHIGFPTLAGLNPLFGPHDERFGLRFPAMADAYDPTLRQLAITAAQQRAITLAEGVYAMVGGPSFETQAELRMLRILGADAVGMSTVPEVIVARQMGLRVLAVSIVTNVALAEDQTLDIPDHEHVLATAAVATERLTLLLSDVISQLA